MCPVIRLKVFYSILLFSLGRYLFAVKGLKYEDVRVKGEQWPELKPSRLFSKRKTQRIRLSQIT